MRTTVDHLAVIEQSRFSINEYRGLAEAPPFTIVQGSIPALVSAPHAVTHVRGGRIKASEDFTGPIALEIARVTGAHAIIATRTDGSDSNFDPLGESAYKQALVECVRQQGVRLVVDVHGMMAASPAIIALGTGDGANVAAWPEVSELARCIIEERLAPFARKYEKQIAVDGRYAARDADTVCSTVARTCKAAALQVELSTLLRFPGGSTGRKPAGEGSPFPGKALFQELAARSNPNPEAVQAAMEALADIVLLGAPV